MKISLTKINVSIAAVIYGWIPLSLRGVVKNIMEAWPTVLSVGWVGDILYWQAMIAVMARSNITLFYPVLFTIFCSVTKETEPD